MWLPSLPLFARRLRWIRYSTVTTQSGSDPLPRWATKLTKPNITILSSSHFNTFRLGQERYEGILHTPGFKLSSFHSNDTFELGEVSFELLLFQRYGGRAWDCGKLRQELASGSRRKWANHCRRRPTGMSLHVAACLGPRRLHGGYLPTSAHKYQGSRSSSPFSHLLIIPTHTRTLITMSQKVVIVGSGKPYYT